MTDNPFHPTQGAEPSIVGGGPKKVLYTLRTLQRIGLQQSGKALKSHNACKACGLGMGGQRGGMVNELGEFPSVCNKSIQAQSTDIQPPIPQALFRHSLKDFQQLSDHELEHLGRLNVPLYKPAVEVHYQPLTWDDALAMMARRFAATEPSRTFFYSSGRSSNEAGFTLQLVARLFGTNNIHNCSFYCHQATSVGLKSSLGISTASVKLEDLQHAELIFVVGANPASNHPRLLHQLKNCRDRGGQVIIINPAREPGLVRFAVPKSARSMITGGTWIASEYLQPRINGDLALFSGIGKALLESDHVDHAFITAHTDGFSDYRRSLELLDWQQISDACGVSTDKIREVAECYARADRAIFAWGMGVTHHLNGADNVEAIANLALLRGQVGKIGAGLLPLRGHSNVQGIGSVGVKPVLLEDVYAHIESHLGVALPRAAGMDTLACLHAAYEGNIDAAMMLGGNLYSASPNAQWTQAAMDRIGFKVYLATTMNRGHVTGMEHSESLILPVAARDEEWQPTTQESMFNYVRLSDGGIQRHDGVLPETLVLCEFARRLLPDCPVDFDNFKNHDTIRAAIAAAIPGFTELGSIGTTKQEFTAGSRILHNTQFQTPSGRASFRAAALPGKLTSQDYPWLLASVRSEGQFNSIIYEEQDSYRGTLRRWSLLMNPDDMVKLGIEDGETVDVSSAHGVMTALQVKRFDVSAGCVLAYYPEANRLIGSDHDPRSKTPAFKSVAVNIVSAHPGSV